MFFRRQFLGASRHQPESTYQVKSLMGLMPLPLTEALRADRLRDKVILVPNPVADIHYTLI